MSPVGDLLRVRCRKFPSLVNCCTLDWFSSWPEEALLYVSRAFLKDVDLPSEELRENLAKMCTTVHLSVESVSNSFWEELRRRVYTTPKSYLDLIGLYKNTLSKKRGEMNANKNRLANGLKKLETTNTNIAELKITLAEMQPQLVLSNEKLKETLIVVNRDKAIADEKERLAMIDQQVVQTKAAEAKVVKDDADEDLARALPILKKAKQIVDALDKAAVGEIKGYAQPPPPVVMTMEAVVTIFG
jgi:dynein heavy chain, axonemal